MTHASLFSGIGGAELAASWMGWDNLFHCEINPFGRKVLDYWFPKSKSYEDITKTDFREWRGKIDVLTGGFPCQPFSQAGKRKGDTDNRYLWPQMLRAIKEIRPTWVVGENVAGIVTMVESCEEVEMGSTDDIFEKNILYRKEQEFTIERICKDFESEGYSVQPIVIPACAVGAPHRRDRVWFIAHRDNAGDESQQSREELSNKFETIANTRLQRQKKPKEQTVGAIKFYECKTITDTESSRGRKIHNENEQKQSDGHGINCNGDERTVANTYGDRWRIGENEQKLVKGGKRKTNNSINGKAIIKTDWHDFPTKPPVCCGNDGISDRLDGITFPKWRAESIKAYGNAWVPQVAYELFKAINNI